jgi:archaemetzincin
LEKAPLQLKTHPTKPDSSAHLDLIPMGKVDPLAASVIAANLQTVVGLNTRILKACPEPEYSFSPRRGQYDAGKILADLTSISDGAKFRLGVVHVDIYTPILTFVFGESQLGGKAALISLFRIHDRDPALIYDRAAKIAIHELGHLLGIVHCRAPDCLMDFSQNVEKLDALPLRFCDACEYEATRRLKHLFNTP